MSRNLLVRKLRLEHVEFINAKELKSYCDSLSIDYDESVRYLLTHKYMTRIFRGVFYFRSIEERDSGTSSYNHLELVAKGLGLKGVKNWYFGLHTALKFNNVTHESFNVEDVISSSLFRSKPMEIAGNSFKFYKVSAKLMGFGIIEKESIRYSDLEKTLLDFAYLWKYGGLSDAKIVADLSEWSNGASKKKIKSYMHNYPKALGKAMEELMK